MRPAHCIVTAEANARVEKGPWTPGFHSYNGHTTAPTAGQGPGVSKRSGAGTSAAQCLACSNGPAGFLFPLCRLLTLGSSQSRRASLLVAWKEQCVESTLQGGSRGCHGKRLSLTVGGSGALGLWGLRQTWVDGWQAVLLEGRSPGPQQHPLKSRENRDKLWEARWRALARR